MPPPSDPAPLSYPRMVLVGDTGVLVELGDAIDPQVNARVLALAAGLRELALAGVRDVVPTYASVLVHLDPDAADQEAVAEAALSLAGRMDARMPEGRAWLVPVAYGGEHGVDLAEMAAEKGMSEAELVGRHTAPTYRVYMIGFQPGFAYLGGLDPTLARSRRTDPRPRTPAGSAPAPPPARRLGLDRGRADAGGLGRGAVGLAPDRPDTRAPFPPRARAGLP